MAGDYLSGVEFNRAICRALNLPQEFVRRVSVIGDPSNVATVEIVLILSAENLKHIAREIRKATEP